MWRHYTLFAMDLANERAREAREEAERWHITHARERRALERAGMTSAVRMLLARLVLRFSDLTGSLSDAACRAATRIEGRTA